MTTPRNGTQDAGDEHPLPGARLAEEMRLLLDALAQRAEPLLNRLATAPTGEHGEHTPATCGWCPLCAGLAVLRGERPELAVKAAEHAAGLLTVLRTALADGRPATHEPAPAPEEPARERVQHITVRRREAGSAQADSDASSDSGSDSYSAARVDSGKADSRGAEPRGDDEC